MANQKKRTAWSVQDVINGAGDDYSVSHAPNSRFKSGYSGPKKTNSAVMNKINAENARRGAASGDEVERLANQKRNRYQSSNGSSRRNGNNASSSRRSSNNGFEANNAVGQTYASSYGIFDYAWILFAVILAFDLILSVSLYSIKGSKPAGYTYPSYIFTFNGVLNSIYSDYEHGGLGSSYTQPSEEEESVDTGMLLGETTNSSSLPNTTTGATMALDAGGTYADYNIATSHEELITQLTRALESNDFGFVGMKLSYEDDATGELIGYPQSVVEHFTRYMSDNTGKREIFLSTISDASEYSVKNGAAYLVKLPILKFTINMGYDNTNVSISGFSDQKMDAGQSAVVSPLLPCMYTITVTTDGGSQSSEVECDMSEGNLQVNIGVTN